MKRILAISDIHGELELFDSLLEKLNYDADEDQLILLGDYVDRGRDSKGVLNRVSELKRNGAIVLRGNHDEMMLNAVNGVPEALERWERNGALITLQSHDSSIENVTLSAGTEFEKHISLIREMDYYYETKDYIFVHAGVSPDIPVQKTDPHTFVWIRDLFYEKYSGDKTVIFGHTPTSVIRQKRITMFILEKIILSVLMEQLPMVGSSIALNYLVRERTLWRKRCNCGLHSN